MVQIILLLYLNYQCMSFAFDDQDEKKKKYNLKNGKIVPTFTS